MRLVLIRRLGVGLAAGVLISAVPGAFARTLPSGVVTETQAYASADQAAVAALRIALPLSRD